VSKIAIVVGHNSRSQGAVRILDGRTEFDWNSDLAQLIKSHDNRNVKIFYRRAGFGYSKEIDTVYAETDTWGADVTVELHFNASANENVRGCEMLSSGTSGSLELSNNMQNRVQRVMGNPDRGVKRVSRSDRGGRSLWAGKAPAVLIEPYFGSNYQECTVATNKKQDLAKAIYQAAKESA
jgi:N-acetylmuramoyl-L-alanine amidase